MTGVSDPGDVRPCAGLDALFWLYCQVETLHEHMTSSRQQIVTNIGTTQNNEPVRYVDENASCDLLTV
jgi:hypothetical protein